jgi:Holliday junction DNA helicase RuvA
MIRRLTGRVLEATEDTLILDVAGVGFEVACPGRVAAELAQRPDEVVTVHVHLSLRQDEISLFGFREERDLLLFRRLLTVSGVGPRMALGMLERRGAGAVARSITDGDAAGLGAPRRMAERVILQLRDRVSDLADPVVASGASGSSEVRELAVNALERMSFATLDAQSAVSLALTAPEVDRSSVAAVVAAALRRLDAGRRGAPAPGARVAS